LLVTTHGLTVTPKHPSVSFKAPALISHRHNAPPMRPQRRLIDMSEIDDPRIDVCIYCLPPHRVRQNDIRYMAELGKLVPILPVVTKVRGLALGLGFGGAD